MDLISSDRAVGKQENTQAASSKISKFSPPRMPLAISSQQVNIWYHTDLHGQWKRVTWPVFF